MITMMKLTTVFLCRELHFGKWEIPRHNPVTPGVGIRKHCLQEDSQRHIKLREMEEEATKLVDKTDQC